MFTDTAKLRQIATALNHPVRQEIINLIEINEAITVTDLWVKLRKYANTSPISIHLAALRNAGIVTSKKSGSKRYYSINQNFKIIYEN